MKTAVIVILVLMVGHWMFIGGLAIAITQSEYKSLFINESSYVGKTFDIVGRVSDVSVLGGSTLVYVITLSGSALVFIPSTVFILENTSIEFKNVSFYKIIGFSTLLVLKTPVFVFIPNISKYNK